MERVQEFIRTYNNLDSDLRRILRLDSRMSHMKALDIMAKKNEVINRNLSTLKQYARLRNCIIHDTSTGEGKAIAIPLQEIVDDYRDILNKFNNPLTVFDICTHRSNMILASPESLVIDVMESMNQLLISRVPVVKKECVIGMFSGNTLIYYLMDKRKYEIPKNLRMKELSAYTDLDKQKKERFEFISKNINIFDAKRYFKKSIKKEHKLVGLIVTSDGSEKGKILGLLTEWDIFKSFKK